MLQILRPCPRFVAAVAATLLAAPALAQEGYTPQIETQPVDLYFLRPDLRMVEPPTTKSAVPGFTINVVFVGGLTASQQAIFTDAKLAWERRISGYQPGIMQSSITINAEGDDIDGVGGILGQAGPTSYTVQGGFAVALTGAMTFDSADLANLETQGALDEVIEHEMGHVLGIGTLWVLNGNYTNGTFQYTGANALATWKSDYSGQAGATFVPVEDQGGLGTADGHWNENAGGAGPVGITNLAGRDMQGELMTGWLNLPVFYGTITHEHLPELGFEIYPYDNIFTDGFESGDALSWTLSSP